MKVLKCISTIFAALLIVVNIDAQQTSKNKPFSISIGSITITGTYSEGWLYRNTVNGTSILWGLVSWGGSETIDCRPGTAVCKVETILSVGFRGFRTNERGLKGLEETPAPTGTYPVLITTDGKSITFAVDMDQVSQGKKGLYQSNEWVLENGFILSPSVVKELKLYNGPEQMGYLIPAGNYPLRRDGNIGYWTWQKPE